MINKKLIGTAIEALSNSHGEKILAIYKKAGFDTGSYAGTRNKANGYKDRYYGVDINGYFGRFGGLKALKATTLAEAEAIISNSKEVNKYPRTMWVWDNIEDRAAERVVFAEATGKTKEGTKTFYLAWSDMDGATPVTWKNASVKDPRGEEITKKEAADLIWKHVGRRVNIQNT